MLPERLRAVIQGIRTDRQNGAAELTRRAADALASVQDQELVIEAAQELSSAQPSMASIQRLADLLMSEPAKAARICRDAIERIDTAPSRIAAHTAKLIRPAASIMTNSFSSTVLPALRAAAPARVFVTESRPGGEGITLARELGSCAIVIADASVHRMMPQVDLVLVGADCVSPVGVVNKVGTALVALSAREHQRPMYSACDTGKFIARPLPEGELFETTPLDWFAGVITERGVLTHDEARDLARRSRGAE
jgi:translation initiation factor 2B subunit (eIF-2B alpha/beta/delta family)